MIKLSVARKNKDYTDGAEKTPVEIGLTHHVSGDIVNITANGLAILAIRADGVIWRWEPSEEGSPTAFSDMGFRVNEDGGVVVMGGYGIVADWDMEQ
jgi:hypothetical protein